MDNLVASKWERRPIMGGELCTGLWVQFLGDYHWQSGIPETHWALVQTVMHWPSDQLPASYVFAEDDEETLIECRRQASAAYSFIELEWDGAGMHLDLAYARPAVEQASALRTKSKWFLVAKMLEMVVLARSDEQGRPVVGEWPQPLDAARSEQVAGEQVGEQVGGLS